MNILKLCVSVSALSLLAACGGSSSSGNSGGSGVTPPPSNVAPVATDGTETLIQDAGPITITLAATDADNDTLTYTIGTQPSSGTATVSGNTVTYTPNAGYSGADSFTFIANDGTVNSNTATVSLTIDPASNFAGRITTADGTVLANITVDALDAAGAPVTSVTSDTDGAFLLKAVTDTDLVLKLSADGYADQILPVTMPSLKSSNTPLDVVMTSRGAPQTIDIDAGGTLTDANGASVTLTAGSFVDANGAAVTGTITATITSVDVSDPTTLAAFPGAFKGIPDMGGAETAIVSLGTTEYVFTQNGAPLQLNTGATADIEIPIYSAVNPQTGNAVQMGDQIELWSLNEDTGIWEQEGMGTVVANTASPTGLAMRATVSHFTWWNVDYPVETADATITLTGNVDGGVAVIYGRVNGFPGFRTATQTVTVGSTTPGLLIPKDQTTCFWIEYLDAAGGTAYSNEQCVTNAVGGASYPLSFAVITTGSLSLNDSVGYRNSYFTGKPVSIRLYPASLEAAVTYAVTTGTLPAGLTLSNDTPTRGLISGSTTALGTYNLTVTGTDSDGFTDTRNISFSVVDTPPPSLRTTSGIYANIGDTVTRNISVQSNGGDAPTSWIITQTDGSPVPANVSISNAGVVTIANYDGVTASYSVSAYNAKGASNVITVTVQDVATAPPSLSPAYNIVFMTGQGTISENLSGANTGAPATSWTITLPNGNPAPSGVSISNAGVVTLQETDAINTYNVTAFNGSNASGVMQLSFTEDMGTMPGMCPDPNDPFC